MKIVHDKWQPTPEMALILSWYLNIHHYSPYCIEILEAGVESDSTMWMHSYALRFSQLYTTLLREYILKSVLISRTILVFRCLALQLNFFGRSFRLLFQGWKYLDFLSLKLGIFAPDSSISRPSEANSKSLPLKISKFLQLSQLLLVDIYGFCCWIHIVVP